MKETHKRATDPPLEGLADIAWHLAGGEATAVGPRVTLDREDIDAIAKRVVELIEGEVPAVLSAFGRLVDAATAARLLGVSRATVYAKADELGAIRVGRGKKARLRFDPATLRRPESKRPDGGPVSSPRRPRRKSPQRADRDLLPIRGGRNGGRGRLGS